MAHPNIPGGHSSEEARQKAEGEGEMEQKPNAPGVPSAIANKGGGADANKMMLRGRGKQQFSKEKAAAIERRMKNLSGGNKKGAK